MSAGYAHNDLTIIGTDPGVCAGLQRRHPHAVRGHGASTARIPGATVVDVTDTAMLEDILPQLVSRARA